MPSELDEQQRILSEVSHDLANRFHRSYYYLDLLEDEVSATEGEASSLVARLRETVGDIETMARGALSFVRPIELRPLRVKLDDLTASLRQHVGMRRVELTGAVDAGGRELSVDPARISETLAFLCRISVGRQSEAPFFVELLDGELVGLRVRRDPDAPALAPSDLGLALCAKIARLHGGDLALDDSSASSLTLRLPVARREA